MTLPDEVWQTLDRDAGRLSRRAFWLLLASLVVAALAAGTVVVGWRTLTDPLTPDGSFAASATLSPMRFDVTFGVRNDGRVPITIEGIGRAGEALTLLAAWAEPKTVQPGEVTTLHVEYAVADCRDYVRGDWPLPVRIHRPWGVQTVYVVPESMPNPDAPTAYSFTGGHDPYELPWQESYVRRTCAPHP
ncbi:MAG: hypothetical protein HOV71_24215 [Hamadaea sp.]|nr:hypothetical protein [Hamadaea sp.]NUT07909.1 hypothetical protein [Hamadaea sp.]